MMMPEMNGWEFLEIRRKSDIIKAIPTVVVSAVSPGKQSLGATRVLKKPINLIELIDTIEEHCDRIQ
jgi:CheY-like chemotaxis protein